MNSNTTFLKVIRIKVKNWNINELIKHLRWRQILRRYIQSPPTLTFIDYIEIMMRESSSRHVSVSAFMAREYENRNAKKLSQPSHVLKQFVFCFN